MKKSQFLGGIFLVLGVALVFLVTYDVTKKNTPFSIVNEVGKGCTAGVAIDIPAEVAYCADSKRALYWVDLSAYGPYVKL